MPSTRVGDICWLAGWLEGEGSFTLYEKDTYKQFRIEFSSSDLDVIKQVKRIMGSDETIFLRKQGYSDIGTKKKPEYYMKITKNLAIQWMMTLYTLMGERRKEKIKFLLTEWKDYVGNNSGICRKCRGKLRITIIKSGWYKGKKQSYCSHCIRRRNRLA
jgi:hypothetical protein